jgi:hypothetical protein
MFRVSTFFLALGLSMVLAASCNRADRDESPVESEPTVLGDRNPVRPTPMTVEGCLTASGDRFVLTRLKAEEAAPSSAGTGTEAYRLVGREDELRPHVGKRVRIVGEAEPEQVVDVRQSSPAAEPSQPVGRNQPAGTSGPEAQVGTTETARIEINDLQVRSVTATTEPCVAPH